MGNDYVLISNLRMPLRNFLRVSRRDGYRNLHLLLTEQIPKSVHLRNAATPGWRCVVDIRGSSEIKNHAKHRRGWSIGTCLPLRGVCSAQSWEALKNPISSSLPTHPRFRKQSGYWLIFVFSYTENTGQNRLKMTKHEIRGPMYTIETQPQHR